MSNRSAMWRGRAIIRDGWLSVPGWTRRWTIYVDPDAPEFCDLLGFCYSDRSPADAIRKMMTMVGRQRTIDMLVNGEAFMTMGAGVTYVRLFGSAPSPAATGRRAAAAVESSLRSRRSQLVRSQRGQMIPAGWLTLSPATLRKAIRSCLRRKIAWTVPAGESLSASEVEDTLRLLGQHACPRTHRSRVQRTHASTGRVPRAVSPAASGVSQLGDPATASGRGKAKAGAA